MVHDYETRDLNITEGREIATNLHRQCDVVVVGSGPAGATVARALAREGADVVVVEEGPWMTPDEFPDDMFTALTEMWREMGTQVTRTVPPIPLLQGRLVGGSSVINGAICWRLPREVHEEWCEADPVLRDALPWEELEQYQDEIESELHVSPTQRSIAGRHNLLLGEGADALGLEHRPTRRNVEGACGLGDCMKGCPAGKKTSMDRSYLPEACQHGAEIVCETRVDRIERHRGRATAVEGPAEGGGWVRVEADRAVVLAASALQTPALLWRNRIRHGPVGEHLQCHPGTSVEGRFPDPVRMWYGASQGHEVTGMRDRGMKFESLGYGPMLTTERTGQVGSILSREIEDLDHWANWAVEIRSEAHGTVRPAGPKHVRVRYRLTQRDMRKIRLGVAVLGKLFDAAGADFAVPGVHGWPTRWEGREVIERFEREGPLEPAAYDYIVSHMFGTCRMGSEPESNVVRPDFRHHAVDGLYVADSSVFPTNIGVNPQISIMAMARCCAERIAD